jgi:hypothetical protein
MKVMKLDPFLAAVADEPLLGRSHRQSRKRATPPVAGGAGAEWRRERQELSVDDAALRHARRWSPTTNGQSTTTLRIE